MGLVGVLLTPGVIKQAWSGRRRRRSCHSEWRWRSWWLLRCAGGYMQIERTARGEEKWERSRNFIDAELKIRCAKDHREQVACTPTSISDWLKALMVGCDPFRLWSMGLLESSCEMSAVDGGFPKSMGLNPLARVAYMHLNFLFLCSILFQ